MVLRVGECRKGRWRWICRCDCGETREVFGSNLIRGLSQSCGCLTRERVKEANTTHGRRHTPEYETWAKIIARCENPKASVFAYYGGRGISVCERWRHSFENFFADMGLKPTPKHSIDRIDTNGNYEPSNCRWATHTEQMRNTRRNVYWTYNGESLCLSEWAERYKINQETLRNRLERGESLGDALTRPVACNNRHLVGAR